MTDRDELVAVISKCDENWDGDWASKDEPFQVADAIIASVWLQNRDLKTYRDGYDAGRSAKQEWINKTHDKAVARAATEAERERCAKVVESLDPRWLYSDYKELAQRDMKHRAVAAIRNPQGDVQ